MSARCSKRTSRPARRVPARRRARSRRRHRRCRTRSRRSIRRRHFGPRVLAAAGAPRRDAGGRPARRTRTCDGPDRDIRERRVAGRCGAARRVDRLGAYAVNLRQRVGGLEGQLREAVNRLDRSRAAARRRDARRRARADADGRPHFSGPEAGEPHGTARGAARRRPRILEPIERPAVRRERTAAAARRPHLPAVVPDAGRAGQRRPDQAGSERPHRRRVRHAARARIRPASRCRSNRRAACRLRPVRSTLSVNRPEPRRVRLGWNPQATAHAEGGNHQFGFNLHRVLTSARSLRRRCPRGRQEDPRTGSRRCSWSRSATNRRRRARGFRTRRSRMS